MNDINKSADINSVISKNINYSIINNKYTRFVSLIKLVLISTAAALTLLIITWSFTVSTDKKISIPIGGSKLLTNLSEGLTNGRFIGKDNNNQTYIITANYAEPIDGNPKKIFLKTLQADLTLDNGTWITIKAPGGILNRNTNKLFLDESVYIYADDKFEVFTKNVDVDLSNSIIQSENQIEMQSSLGTLNANSFYFFKNKNNLLFSKVKLTLNPKINK